MSFEEYYQKLSLPPIPPPSPVKTKPPTKFQKYQEQESEKQLRAIISEIDCNEIQDRLKIAMDKIVLAWTDRHDALVDALDDLERSKKKLEHRLGIQSQHYEKSTRETQLYKTRYENYVQQQQRAAAAANNNNNQNNNNNNNPRRRSILVSSNASCLSGKSYVTSSSSARSSSCSSSMRTSFSLVDEMIDPVFYEQQLNDSDDDNNEFDLFSVLSDPDSYTLPNSPYITPVMSPLSLKSPGNNNNNESATTSRTESANGSMVTIVNISDIDEQQPQKDVLTYACGDGFWNTIARGKSNKAEVDTLISNYIRRGGNPNVAKNSDTVKNVKEGYGLIHAIIAVKNTSALQRILDAGANINVCPLTSKLEDKLTPMILAAKLGYAKGVRLLIEQGGIGLLNDSRGPYGENALHAAVQGGSDEMAGYILRLSQNTLLDKADNNGATPLHYACITGKTRLITLFIRDCQGRPDPRDNKGETPLHYAVRNRKLKVIAKLVGELGVYPNPYILKQVPTPLDIAKSGGLKTIAEYLKRVGAKTTKEMEKTSRATTIHSSNSSTFSGESSASGNIMIGPSTAVVGVRQYLHTKTSQILRGTFDL